ncbi:DUF6585 family protein [Ktedonobacter robiniae]|uniref:DUF304 domain-containing protein n=1 Tax=Ktedonobacter robiniae TaxID=2778365 RepID=A0ABQ3UW45_9CHLR|nr:DUF6585 family protein [Ktedonobacter robiniae]GHO56807.1 hypothetical protein KSB_52820 [Ktedonobacter robiniae]
MKPTPLDSRFYESQGLAETYQLGELHKEFTPNIWVYIFIWSSFPIVMLFINFYLHPINDASFATIWLPICGLVILGCLTVIIVLYRGRNRRIYIYEHGLLAVRTNGVEAVRWEEIAIVWHKVTRNKNSITHSYTLQRKDGSEFKLGFFFRTNQKLGSMIEEETARLLFPQARASYQQGQPLYFGPLTLDLSGLTYNTKFLPWNEVEEIQFGRTVIVVKKQGKIFNWASISYGDIPNQRVLQQLSTSVLYRSYEGA